MRLSNHPLSLALYQTMLTLCRAKEWRQHETGHAFKQSSQVPENEFSAVVQRQCNNLDLFIAQSLLAIHHFCVERGVVQFQLIAPQGDGAGFLFSVAAQHVFETLDFKRHDWTPHRTMSAQGDRTVP